MQMMDESSELTEREWRDMRRRMTSLQFDPVPETPPLLPRSAYGGDFQEQAAPATGDLETNRGEEGLSPLPPPPEEMSPSVADVVILDSSASTDSDLDLVPSPSADLKDTPMLEFAAHKSPVVKSTKAPKSPFSSSSSSSSSSLKSASKQRMSTVSPLLKPRRRSSVNDKHASVSSPTSSASRSVSKPATDLSALESTITNAQNTLRLTILTAVEETTSRIEREAALERRKLEAANANRVAVLQSQIEELQAQTQSQQQEGRAATQTLDRVTRLMLKWKQRERDTRAVDACFQAWKLRWQRKKHEHTQQQMARVFLKKQSSQLLLHQWKLMTQQTTWEKKLQALKDEQRTAIDALAAEHAAQMKEMQQALETARDAASVAKQGRQAMEDDLRQVFLRGVSAMNIEALTMFKTNHQLTQQRRASEYKTQQQEEEEKADERDAQGQECQARKVSDASSMKSESTMVDPSGTTPSGGESSEELPSEERMIPVKPPTPMIEDPRVHFQQNLEPGVMPSYALANRLLKNAGTPEIVSTVARSQMEMHTATPPPTAVIHGLRSAELVEAHQRVLHATVSAQQQPPGIHRRESTSSVPAPLSPAKQREKAQSTMQFQVEMELMRSSVATAAYNARFAPPHLGTSFTTRNAPLVRSSRHSSPALSTRRMSSSTSSSLKGK